MCVVDQSPNGGPLVKNECPCNCPLGWIEQGCDHLKNYPESTWGIAQVERKETP